MVEAGVPEAMRLINLSVGGARIETCLDVQSGQRAVDVYVHFQILDKPFNLQGRGIYKKRQLGCLAYGLRLDTDHTMKRQITDALKAFARLLADKRQQEHHDSGVTKIGSTKVKTMLVY